jgi:hypothetical protein
LSNCQLVSGYILPKIFSLAIHPFEKIFRKHTFSFTWMKRIFSPKKAKKPRPGFHFSLTFESIRIYSTKIFSFAIHPFAIIVRKHTFSFYLNEKNFFAKKGLETTTRLSFFSNFRNKKKWNLFRGKDFDENSLDTYCQIVNWFQDIFYQNIQFCHSPVCDNSKKAHFFFYLNEKNFFAKKGLETTTRLSFFSNFRNKKKWNLFQGKDFDENSLDTYCQIVN